jgi:hypothetical protein
MTPHSHTKEDMMEYYITKWYENDGTIDYDFFYNTKKEIVIFKNDPSIYWLDEIICTMDLENLFEMR